MTNLRKYGIIEENRNFSEEALYCIALIYNICHVRMEEFLKPYGLTTGKLNILVAVRFHGGDAGLSQVDLSHHLIVTPSNMTKMIDRLEKEGLVMREPLPGDRRVNIIKVTSQAEKLLDGLWEAYGKTMEGLMAGISSADRQHTAVCLKQWLRNLLTSSRLSA